MNVRESLTVSLAGLQRHKLRSFLTMLGIIFGVAAVIAMLSIGAGAKQEALEQIRMLGLENIILRSRPVTAEEDEAGKVTLARGLTLDDARALNTLNPLITYAVAQKELPEITMRRGSEKATATLIGTTPRLPALLRLQVEEGGFFSFDDLHHARRVCVLGNAIKRKLFLSADPVGAEIKIGDSWFTVVGVLGATTRATGMAAVGERDLNEDVYIPLTTIEHRFLWSASEPDIDQIVLSVKNEERIREAANLVRNLLVLRHNGHEDFQVVVPEALLRQSQRTQQVFNIVMGAIAGISLLVGGIGIMNIMLATILERTREIGIRRALGATRRDILSQFLFESTLLSFSGGLLGILLGVLMTQGIASYANWKTIIEPASIVLAFGVSVTVGIVFGIYPARKAALLDPIESLRHE